METPGMSNTGGLEHYQCSNTVRRDKTLCSAAQGLKHQNQEKNLTLFKHRHVTETQHRCTALTQTISFSVLSLTWLQELSYSWDIAIWERHLKGLLLAGTLCISRHRTFGAAVSVINSSSRTKLCHLSSSVGTSVVFSQVRISHFSQ